MGEDGGARRGEGRCSATQLELERTPRAQPSACCHGNQIPPPTCIPTDWLPLSLLLSLSLFSCLCCIFLRLSYAFGHITWQKCVFCIRQGVYATLEMDECIINNAKCVFHNTKEPLSAFRALSMIMFSYSQLFISKHFLSYPPPESFSVQSYLSHVAFPLYFLFCSSLFILLSGPMHDSFTHSSSQHLQHLTTYTMQLNTDVTPLLSA